MIEQYLLPVLCTLAGLYFLIRNIVFMRNETELRKYVETSPKARRWVEQHGLEGAIRMTRSYLPLGLAMSALLLGVGLWGWFRLLA